MDAHIDYIKYTQENANILRELVKHARALRPLDSDLADSHKTQDSNKHVLPSTGMKSSASASKSQPSGNTKKNRISQTTSSNQKNKVEVHPMSICTTCNECMFDAIHDLCVLDFVNDVNVRSKSNSFKRSKKKTTWKPTVPPKNPLPTKVAKKTTPRRNNPEMLKDVTTISLSSRSKGVESNISNNSEPSQNYGSNVSTAPSSSLFNFRLSKLFSGIVRFGNDQIAKMVTTRWAMLGFLRFTMWK
ncbi:hypothetical protein Tco_0883757, partial [Tanacetum coccineum]